MERKTPLYQTHVDAGGKIVEFGGFLMPVQYPTGVLAEHMAVRQKAGLFDVSHMGLIQGCFPFHKLFPPLLSFLNDSIKMIKI